MFLCRQFYDESITLTLGVIMIGFVTRAVFGLEIVERHGIVRISGIHVRSFLEDINKTFSTTRITVNMLNKATRTYVEFHSFFLIDIEYIIRRLSEEKSTRLGKRGYIKMRETLIENTWLAELDKTHPSIFNKKKLNEIKFELLKHQAEFIDYYDRVIPKYNLRGILMAATPGSGKTISAIAVSCAFEAKNVIIISPKNAVFRVWEKTLLEDMNVKQTVWVQVSGKPMPSPKDCRWFIFHYESLDKAAALAETLKSERCVIVLDESHNLNEMKSLRTERFVNMCRNMQQSIIVELSGTPMKAMGAEAIPLISAIDPLFNNQCVEKFKKIYGREAKAATEILANRLGIIMYKVNKEESKIAEPVEHTLLVKVEDSRRFTLDTIKRDMNEFILERTEHYTVEKKYYHELYYNALKEFEGSRGWVMIDPLKYELYKEYVEEFKRRGYDPMTSPPKAMFCNDIEKNIIIPALSSKTKKEFRLSKSVVKYVNLKIRGECLGTVLSRARTDCNLAVLDALDLGSLIDGAEKKTLVFTSYVELVKATKEKLEAEGYKPLCVFAETNNQLPQMVKQFGEDESINPMIATYQSLSTAVPLTMANRVVLLNAPFRIHEKEQTVARANRIGQDKTVDVYNILLDTGAVPNISTRSNDIMEWSREQVNAIMGFDNKDNQIAIESYDLDEYRDIDEIEPIDVPVVSQESFKETRPMLPHVKKNEFDTLINTMNTSTDFINKVNENLNKGVSLNKISLEMYRVISPIESNIVLESRTSSMQLTMISLEQEKAKTKSILARLLELLGQLFKSLQRHMSDSGAALQDNITRCEQVKKHLSSNASKLSRPMGNVTVSGANWLSRGNNISAINHIRDLKWQADTGRVIMGQLNANFTSLSKDFTGQLDQIAAKPEENQIAMILKRLMVFGKLLPDSSSNKNDTNTTIRSAAMLGGRQFVFQYPNAGSMEELTKRYSMFKLKARVVDNFNIEAEVKAEAMSVPQCHQAMDMVIDMNKQLTHIKSFIDSTNRDVDIFINKAKNVEAKSTSADAAMLTAQITMMTNGLKALATYVSEYIKIVNHGSKASIKYAISSTRDDSKPDNQ